MNGPLSAIRRKLQGGLVLVGAMWGVFLLDTLLYRVDLNAYGLVPRTLWGLLGILTMPFLHADLGHLAANTVPLLVLVTLLVTCRPRPWETLGELALAGGFLLWLLGRERTHVGASNLIYALVCYFLVTGLLEKRLLSLLVAFAVGFLYGGSLIVGVIPGISADVSWDGHLLGAVAGGLVAAALMFDPRQKPVRRIAVRS